jgi:ABC-type hemin transport system ATPase subunit
MQEVVGEQQGQTCFTKDEIADLLASSAVLSEAFYSALRDRCRLLISNMERDKTRNTEELRRLVQEQSEHDSEVTRFIVREVLSLSGGVAQRQEWAKSLLSWVSTTQSRSLDIAELVRFVERL